MFALLAAAVVTSLLGGVHAGAIDLPPADHILVNGNEGLQKIQDWENKGYIYGVSGGGTYFDGSTKTAISNIKKTPLLLAAINTKLPGFSDIWRSIDGNSEGVDEVKEITGDTGLTLEGKTDYTRYYGASGADLVVNGNIGAEWDVDKFGSLLEPDSNTSNTPTVTLSRVGNVNNEIEGGSVIIASGASTAVGVGNIKINIDKSVTKYGQTVNVKTNIETGGNAHAVLKGSINTNAAKDANLVGFINGGVSFGIGGEASSLVTGNSTLTITGTDRVAKDTGFESPDQDAIHQLTTGLNVMKGSNINAFGITGGGAAVSTFGGTATSVVEGISTVNVKDGTVVAAFGGGGAVSADATGVYNLLKKPQYPVGNNDGTVDIDGEQLGALLGKNLGKDDVTITVKEAIQGGTASTTTGNTVVNLEGASSGLGVFGGGAAISTHSYTYRDNNKPFDGYKVGDELGASHASSTTGKAAINVNLKTPSEGGLTDEEKGKMIQALKNVKNQMGPNAAASYDVLRDFSGKGAAVGLFGGGMALAHSTSGQNTDATTLLDTDGSFASASTAGADMNLVSGYAVGVFGGGLAGTMGNAKADAVMTDTVNIDIREKMETVGVFGGGLAAFTGSSNGGTAKLIGTATAAGKDVNIQIMGKADGVFGGGLAIDDSQADAVNAKAEMSGKSAITVYDGAEVSTVNFGAVGTGTAGNGAPSLSDYPKGAKAATETVAIAGGGVALGGGAKTFVKEVEINVLGGTVTGDIIAGGAAAYGYEGESQGSVVEKSTITLAGGTVNGNVYAGGSIAISGNGYDQAKATVGDAAIYLSGAKVTGILSGGGLNNGAANFSEAVKAGTSTLYLSGENTLSLVDGKSKIQGFTKTVAQAGSVTKLEGLTAGDGTPVIDAMGGTVTVEKGASLDISALSKSDKPYYVAGHYNTDASTFWTSDDLLYDRFTSYAEATNQNGKYEVSFQEITKDNADEAAEAFSARLGQRWTKPLIRQGLKPGFGDYEGAKDFFNAWNNDRDTYGDAYSRAGLLGEDTAVTANTASLMRDMADHVTGRLSFTEEYVGAPGWVNEDGGLWAKYVHKKFEAKGLASTVGGLHASSDYDGAIVGMDFAKKDGLQYGAAFHYGTGQGQGVISSNDYDAWGFALYAGLKNEDNHTNLMADIGYGKTSNDITGHVNGKALTASRDVDAWTAGIRGEKEYIFGKSQLVPYAGLRYLHLAPSRYTSYYDGKKAFDYDAENQDLWLLPVGLSLRNETVTRGGWKVTPKVELAYIWAFGDTDTAADIWMNGASSPLAYTVMDDSWLASVGVEATKNVWSYGLSYTYQKGDDTKETKWYVNLSYAF